MKNKKGVQGRLKLLRENYPYLIMALPAIVVVFLFNYLPIYGVLIAFQDFMPGDKILSDTTIWVGFSNFKRFFTDVQFWTLLKNTFPFKVNTKKSRHISKTVCIIPAPAAFSPLIPLMP